MKLHKKNQIRPNAINRIGPTQQVPKKVKLWFKCGTSSMLFCKTDEGTALRLESRLRRFMTDNNTKLEGTFIQTQ